MHFLEAEHLGFYFYPPLIMSLRSTLVLLCQKLQPRKLWLCVCVGKAVCVQCYYSYLTKFTLSSKSAGWHNICIYICVCLCVCVHLCALVCVCTLACVFHCGLLDLLSTSSLVLLPSLPSAYFTLLLSAHTLRHIQDKRQIHTEARHRRTASLCWSHHTLDS